MYALLLPLLFGQCGPDGCVISSGWLQRLSEVNERTTWRPAVIEVETVPPDGLVWFDGHVIRLRDGKSRVRTPPLEPGRYRYRVTARWGDLERQWVLSFSAGQAVHVVLMRDEPATSPPASTKPPESPPQTSLPAVEQDDIQNFGIDRAHLAGAAERITLDGREITRSEAMQVLESGGLADDSGKLRLTVIGPEADRRRVLDDLKGPLSDLADQCLVQDYPPDHWAVTGAGFYTDGKPTIYIQTPDGQVLHRQDDYADGAQGLQQAFERLRRRDPNYRPDKDRDLRRLTDGLLARLFNELTRPFRVILTWLLGAGAVFLLFVLTMKSRFILGLLGRWVPRPPSQSQGTTPTRRRVKRSPYSKR